ncbi:hypothetical protein [Sphingobium nicotianae]|uniref:DUF8021 domain-containing protein n=1 Tax=Sphingobium nicotianae TaxID=2782607 RepID=A0A9X1ISZ4_9SPHN|nr:hypothetical protein [Sphingobium nicotianae]MBT2189106.1 hypothetical protein [Sphingobium nicotianae]
MLRTYAAAFALGLVAAGPAGAQAYGETSALTREACGRTCLEKALDAYVAALAKKDPSAAPLAETVRFTENSVEMPIGQGLWETVSSIVPDDGMKASDPETGNTAWFGHAYEHGKLVFLAIRLKVDHDRITEAETVVSRQTGMPLIFGTGKEPHNPAWVKALTPEQSRPRARLRAVADSYFNTVEYNDGQVFAHFTDDCSRLENGISTTSPTTTQSNSASVASGCENQFKMGIYRINKQLRERRFPLIDVERGIVVGMTFFDHANYFDEYKLTDGRTMKTLLKWPNSLSIMEAFKIIDGKIYTIEANFDYVPYGMHSPWAEEKK